MTAHKPPSVAGLSTSPCKGEVGRIAGKFTQPAQAWLRADGRGSRFSHTRKMTARARRLRAEPTDAEQKLWQALRRNQIDGLSFRRQHPVGPYTLDFYCATIRLGIEIDGGQHNFELERLRDEQRSQWLASKDIKIIRFWNNDTLSNLDGVLEEISRVAQARSNELTPSPTLPLSGGGRKRGRP